MLQMCRRLHSFKPGGKVIILPFSVARAWCRFAAARALEMSERPDRHVVANSNPNLEHTVRSITRDTSAACHMQSCLMTVTQADAIPCTGLAGK